MCISGCFKTFHFVFDEILRSYTVASNRRKSCTKVYLFKFFFKKANLSHVYVKKKLYIFFYAPYYSVSFLSIYKQY